MATTPTTSQHATPFDEAYQGPDRPQATEEASIAVSTFDVAYSGTPPWDIGGPQPAFVSLAESGVITGRILDVGCGTGELALFLAQQGLTVLGLDASAAAIGRARAKATERRLQCEFVVGNALDLASLDHCFDTVIDSGLLHVLSDVDRPRLVAGVHAVLRPGGRYLMQCFSEHASVPGPRRLTQDDIRRMFAQGWRIESIVASHFEIKADPGGTWRSEDAAAWLARIQRI